MSFCEAMRSVPPRGSGWVVDGAAIKPRESGFAEQSGFGSDPPATREVVLTSLPSNCSFSATHSWSTTIELLRWTSRIEQKRLSNKSKLPFNHKMSFQTKKSRWKKRQV